MIQTRRTNGYTLVELMASTVILTSVLGVLLSVITSLRKTAEFRNDNQNVTQAANFSYETLSRSLRSAGTSEALWDPSIGGCVYARGFYLLQNGLPLTGNTTQTDVPIPLSAGQKIVTVSTEKVFKPNIGNTYEYVKREYELGNNDADENGAVNQTILETTYHANPDPNTGGGLGYQWPVNLTVCNSSTSLHWDNASATTRKLTASNSRIKSLSVRFAAPLTKDNTPALINSPFATIELTADHPTKTTVPTLTLRSTITPTFSYGELRE
jgi:type II secretory pathway pseudopilin PulG